MERTNDIIRAWKDSEYREGLSEQALDALPAHPAGRRRFADDEWRAVAGAMAAPSHMVLTLGCCDGFTESPGFCSWFCGSGLSDTTYGCCTPNR